MESGEIFAIAMQISQSNIKHWNHWTTCHHIQIQNQEPFPLAIPSKDPVTRDDSATTAANTLAEQRMAMYAEDSQGPVWL